MANLEQNSSYALLRETIKKKDKVTAQNLILNNADVNNPGLKCNTPLHWAIAQFEDLDIVKLLLDKGANIYAENQYKLKPLDIAIQNNKTQAALLLIRKGALVGEDLNNLLLETIEQNNYTVLKSLIDNRTQDNRSIDFTTLFNTAISRGHTKIIEHILPHCRFLQPSDKYIPREIVNNYRQQFKDCVELLLKWNFVINPNSNQDEDFVYAAVENGHLQIVLQLLKLGIDVNLVNSKTRLNLLKVACMNKHHEIVKYLLKHNASVNLTAPTNTEILNSLSQYYCHSSLLLSYNKNNLWGITCLHIAVLNSDPIMTNLLLQHGAMIIDDPTFFNITCIAVRNNCEKIVRIFLDQGVDVNDIDLQEKSLLHYCVHSGRNGPDSKYNIVKLLLEKGATTHILTPGNSLIFEAITNGHHKIAQLFLDYNAHIQYSSSDGDTALHKAIEKNFDVEFIKALLNRNLRVDAVNKNMFTPLHYVSKFNHDMTANIIQLLLKHNGNIEAMDVRGWTPLFVACESGNDVAVQCLLDNSANANHTDLENLTPLYIAAKYCDRNSSIVKLLLEKKVNVHCMDKQGKSIIHHIVESNNAELIERLAHTQVNFNSVNKEGDTPLQTAVKNQCIDVIKNLIKYGASINVLDKNNRTPLQNTIKNISIFVNKLEDYRISRHSYWGHKHYSDDSDEDGYDTDYFFIDTHICRKIQKILKIQVIKLKIAGLKVTKENQNIVYNPDDYCIYEFSNSDEMDYEVNVLQLEINCRKEIEKLRKESIGFQNMTFYDLLKKNIHFLSRFVKNKKIRQTLDLEIYNKKFPLYIDIIRSRFRDAKLRYRLMESAKNYFILNICSQLPDNSVDAILSYLNIKEIKMFIRAIKPLDSFIQRETLNSD